jgi:hypothetical protein
VVWVGVLGGGGNNQTLRGIMIYDGGSGDSGSRRLGGKGGSRPSVGREGKRCESIWRRDGLEEGCGWWGGEWSL